MFPGTFMHQVFSVKNFGGQPEIWGILLYTTLQLIPTVYTIRLLDIFVFRKLSSEVPKSLFHVSCVIIPWVFIPQASSLATL
jgi:hypothetical protein